VKVPWIKTKPRFSEEAGFFWGKQRRENEKSSTANFCFDDTDIRHNHSDLIHDWLHYFGQKKRGILELSDWCREI
jgi:hypothetical protein